MMIAVANIKGGVGKTTTAIHLAACLQTFGPTLLLDGDRSRNATKWNTRGKGLPFRVAGATQGTKMSGDFLHIVLDTGQSPSVDDFADYIDGYDLLIVPAVASANANAALLTTIADLVSLHATSYAILINQVPPPPQNEAALLRRDLEQANAPVFDAEVPRLKVIERASVFGTTVNDTSIFAAKDRPRAQRAWDAYKAITQEALDACQSA